MLCSDTFDDFFLRFSKQRQEKLKLVPFVNNQQEVNDYTTRRPAISMNIQSHSKEGTVRVWASQCTHLIEFLWGIFAIENTSFWCPLWRQQEVNNDAISGSFDVVEDWLYIDRPSWRFLGSQRNYWLSMRRFYATNAKNKGFFTSFLLTLKVDSQAVSKSATWFPGASYKYQSVPLIWESLDQCFVVICARSGAHFFYFCWILRMWWYEWIWSYFTHPRHRIITKYTTSKSKEYCY